MYTGMNKFKVTTINSLNVTGNNTKKSSFEHSFFFSSELRTPVPIHT